MPITAAMPTIESRTRVTLEPRLPNRPNAEPGFIDSRHSQTPLMNDTGLPPQLTPPVPRVAIVAIRSSGTMQTPPGPEP